MKPDKFYKNHFVTPLGNVVTQAERERIEALWTANAEVKEAALLPLPPRPTRGEIKKQAFEEMREAVT